MIDWKNIWNGSWMSNELYHVQAAHALAAGFAVLVGTLYWGLWGMLGVLAIGIPFITLKEYWYDLKIEVPHDSVYGSTLDFVSYMIGATVASALSLIRLYAMKS